MSTKNRAAWISSPKSSLEVKEAPYPSPGPNKIVVKTIVVAINPQEYKVQDYDPPIAGKPLSYPTIRGADLAGIIVEIGPDVRSRSIGQRVIANCVGLQLSQPARSAFQEYALPRESEPTAVPDYIPLTSAVVLPLALETASAGLFAPDQLGLSTAKLQHPGVKREGEEVQLVWGCSSSVGCCVIQLAVAAGYQVYTTASKHNHDLCLSLGATRLFDHRAGDVKARIEEALKGRPRVGALDCMVDEEKTMMPLGRIMFNSARKQKNVAVLGPKQETYGDGAVKAVRVSIPSYRKCEAFHVVHQWVPQALGEGKLKPKPDAQVIGEGLEMTQAGTNRLREGVSAMKIVMKVSDEH